MGHSSLVSLFPIRGHFDFADMPGNLEVLQIEIKGSAAVRQS